MDRITVIIRPVDWTQGDVYGFRLRLSGENPRVSVDWGNGNVKHLYGSEIEEYHVYTKNEHLQFNVELTVISGEVEFIDPSGGECDIESIDFRNSPSVKEIWIENCRSVLFDNPNLERLTLRLYNGCECDFSKCPELRELYFERGINMKELNLLGCHKLEQLEVQGSWQTPELSKIIIANDAPLKHIRLSAVNLSKGCRQFIERLIEGNKGDFYYEE